MSKLTTTKKKLQSKIEAIKKINDDTSVLSEDVSDKYLKDKQSIDGFIGKKATALSDKIKQKKENTKDIFEDMLGIVNQFLGSDKKSKGHSTDVYQKGVPVNSSTNGN